MKLKTYLQETQTTQREFSEKLSIHYMHLSKIINGSRRPSAELAAKIETATNGKVTRMELLYPNL